MQNLLQISTSIIGAEKVNSVNARDLHTALEIKRDFNAWMSDTKEILESYDEGVDYIRTTKDRNNSVVVVKQGLNLRGKQCEYIMTLDMCKHISMLSKSKKGREVRKYFIDFEKKAQNVIQSQSSQIQLMQEMLNQVAITDQRVTKIESNFRIENWQQKKLEDIKNRKVYEIVEKHDFKNDVAMIKKLHTRVWKCLKNRFSIPRYNELPICEFENGVSYIQKLALADLI